MQKIVALCLVVILITSLVGAVLAKGGQGKQEGAPHSPLPSGQEDQPEDPGNGPDQPQPKGSQDKNRHEQLLKRINKGRLNLRLPPDNFGNALWNSCVYVYPSNAKKRTDPAKTRRPGRVTWKA